MKFSTKLCALALGFLTAAGASRAQSNGTIVDAPQDGDLNGSNFTYPWPLKLFRFTSQLEQVEMAFMDVAPADGADGRVAVLLHGKNFCAATWEVTVQRLSEAGYRVVVPDQVGFCKSSKPARYQFSLQQLCANTAALLQALEVTAPAVVVGHSLGGMTAARCALMDPDAVAALVLVNPLGLEDWKALGVPHRDVDALYATERASDYDSVRAYQQETYYLGEWSEEYDVWARMLAAVYAGSEAEAFALDMALTTDMALSQPVVYEFPLLRPRTLLLIGERDVTALGAQWSPPEVRERLGHYDVLGERAAAAVPHADLVEFPDLGHAPQIQAPDRFHEALMAWLEGISI